MPGLTQEQRTLIEQRYCARGHRFDGANYPTPEGVCPLCAYPWVRSEIDQYQRLVAEQAMLPEHMLRERQSVGLHVQGASPSLTALSER